MENKQNQHKTTQNYQNKTKQNKQNTLIKQTQWWKQTKHTNETKQTKHIYGEHFAQRQAWKSLRPSRPLRHCWDRRGGRQRVMPSPEAEGSLNNLQLYIQHWKPLYNDKGEDISGWYFSETLDQIDAFSGEPLKNQSLT